MGTLKSINKIILLILLGLFLSCNKDNNNQMYIASGKGFWISFLNANKNLKLEIRIKSRQIKNSKIALNDYRFKSNFNFFIQQKVALKDTIYVVYGSKNMRLYGFKNITETVASQGKKIDICRVSEAILDGRKIEDVDNNFLLIDLK